MPILSSSLAFRFAAVLAAVWGGIACSSDSPDDDWSDCGDKCDEISAPVAPVSAPGLLINDLAVLGELEDAGFDVASAFDCDGKDNAELSGSSGGFSDVVAVITEDIEEMRRNDSQAGVGLAYVHRLFDASWLTADRARFRLVSIAHRPDLAHETPGACGQVRFVYRLMYTHAQGSSRLPMTLMAVREQPAINGSCDAVARKWLDQGGTSAAALLPILERLPLAATVEANLQGVRWPSTIRGDFGGYAEYILRVFAIDGQSATPIKLSNTISPNLSEEKKAELEQWIIESLPEIDRGTASVPDEFLATQAISVSPRGLARGANRPYLAAFPNPELTFGDVDFSGSTLLKSPAGLLRRLDTMTCQGCHQSRGLAGFHILGEDDKGEAGRINTMAVGSSPHVNEELPFRQRVLDDIAMNFSTEEARPFAERAPSSPGIYGAHCNVSGDPSFADWTCAAGFKCGDLSGDEIGMCIREGAPGAGDACEASTVNYHPDGQEDSVSNIEDITCGILPNGRYAYCNHSGVDPHTTSKFGGFPNGSCSNKCGTMGAENRDEDTICGAHPPGGFTACLASGKPFTDCLSGASSKFRRRCDAETPCGEDYVCAGVPGANDNVGACMPPYFIFQVRVDGHPSL